MALTHAPQTDPQSARVRKHVQPWPRFQREVFDDIEGIQFRVARGHVRQIPTRRWGRATHPPNGIQSAMAFEHAPDGSQARQFAFGAGSDQRICNGLRADESQITLAQFLTQGEDAALQDDVGLTTLLARRVRLVRPIHPLQLLSARPSQPVLQVPQSHPKQARHDPLQLPTANRHHHRPPIFFREFFILKTIPTDLDQMTLP